VTEDDLETVPDSVTLQWIGRHLVATRSEMRRNIRALRDDVGVMAAILRRVENTQTADREEWRGLFDAIRNVRHRVEAIEKEREP
jgi:hypothetical protein